MFTDGAVMDRCVLKNMEVSHAAELKDLPLRRQIACQDGSFDKGFDLKDKLSAGFGPVVMG